MSYVDEPSPIGRIRNRIDCRVKEEQEQQNLASPARVGNYVCGLFSVTFYHYRAKCMGKKETQESRAENEDEQNNSKRC